MGPSRTSSRRRRGDHRETMAGHLTDLCGRCVGTSVTAVALIVFTATQALAQAPVTLQYHWKQGEPVTYRTTLKTDSTVSGMQGGDVTLTQTMTQQIKLMPAAVAADGTVTLQQTIEAVSVEMSTPMGTIAYDSAKPSSADQDEASAALGKVFGSIVGATLSVTMASSGAVQRIDGVQKALDRITQELPQDRGAAQMAQSLKMVLSESAIRASLEQSFPRMPPQPVKPGDTWTAQVALGSDVAGRITGVQTMTLKSADGGVASIDVALALKQESAPPMGPSGMTVKLGDSHGAGSITFNVTAGRITAASMKTEMPSTMTATAPDGRPSTMKNTTRTSMTMEEIK
jgi:Family of unknown function (DUF6263)